jgi:transposase
MFNKSDTTIATWITTYESGDGVTRADRKAVYRKYSEAKRQWLVDLYKTSPILYLDEAKDKFDSMFHAQISRSYICIILREAGLT